MGEEICKFISGSPSKLSSRWFSFSWLTGANIGCSWIWSRLFINGHRIDSPSLFFSSWFFIYLVSYKHKSLFSWPVAPFVVSFFWGANLHCFLLLVCHLWFLGTQEKNRQAVSLSGACQDPNAYLLAADHQRSGQPIISLPM